MLWCAGGQTCSLNPAMPICKVGLEDIRHCLFTCDRARLVLATLGLIAEIDKPVIQDRSGYVNLDTLIRLQKLAGDIQMAELILVAMWFIWWQRRQVSKGETISTPEQSAISIRVLATNFVRANTPKLATYKKDQVWKKPGRGVIKLNVDASFHEENLHGACGVVARDDHDKLLGAATQVLPHVSSAGSAEILAIRSGLYLAANL